MSRIANLDKEYPGYFSKESTGQRNRMSAYVKQDILRECRCCGSVANGLLCDQLYREASVGSGDCWHPVGTLLVRLEVQEWAVE